MRKLVKDPKKVWVSNAASRALLASVANARPRMAGPVVENGNEVLPWTALTGATHA